MGLAGQAREDLTTAKAKLEASQVDLDDTSTKLAALKAGVPGAFDQARDDYLAQIEARRTLIEQTYQSTLGDGFRNLYLRVWSRWRRCSAYRLCGGGLGRPYRDGMTYLDHAASSPLLPEVAEAMSAVQFAAGNPSSLHASGRRRRALLEDARESIAADLGASPIEVVFTSGGTEGDNLAVLGGQAARVAREASRAAVVVSATEHPAVLAVAKKLPDVRVASVDADGALNLDEFDRLLDEQVAVVSVMWVNNETGVIQPIEEVVARGHAAGAWVHTDAVQAVGHLPVTFGASGLDLLSFTAHKLGGPVGIGALLVRREVAPVALGFGGSQERDLRPGTSNATLAVGLAAAVRGAVGRLEAESARLSGLRARLVDGVLGLVSGASVNGGVTSPNIVNVYLSGVRAGDVMMLLDAAGVECSTGSACHAGVPQPSDVLLAMGRTPQEASGALRFSFGAQSTEADVDRLLAVLPEAMPRAQAAFG